MIRLLLGLCVFTSSLYGQGAVSLDRAHVLEAGIDWLAGELSPEDHRVSVYVLDCGDCLQELGEAMAPGAEGSLRFFIATDSVLEREIAQALLSVAFAQEGRAQRAQAFREALSLYLESPDVYFSDPEGWKAVCEGLGENRSGASWAKALNLLDRQGRLLGLMGIMKVPTKLDLKNERVVLRASRQAEDSLSKMRDRRLGLRCLYPESLKAGVQRLELDPFAPIPRQTWAYLSAGLENGFAWHWTTSEEQLRGTRFLNWQSGLLALPSEKARKAAIVSALRRISSLPGTAALSLEQAFKYLKIGETAASDERMAEARDLLSAMRRNAALTRYR